METKRTEIIHKNYVDTYIAVDGTEFDDKEQCEKYEASAFGVLLGRIHNIAIMDGTEYDVFAGAGCEDTRALVVSPKDENEVKDIQQLAHLKGYGDWKQKNADKVAVGKVLSVMVSYDGDNVWIIDLDELVRNATGGKYGIVAK